MSFSDALRIQAELLESSAVTLRAQADELDTLKLANDPNHLLTVRQVADRLSVHVNTVHSMIQSGELAATKVRNQWRIAPADVARLMIRSVS